MRFTGRPCTPASPCQAFWSSARHDGFRSAPQTCPLEPLEQIALLAAHVFDAPMAVLHCADGVTPPLRASVGCRPRTPSASSRCAPTAPKGRCPDGGAECGVTLVLARHPMAGRPHIRFYACAPWSTPAAGDGRAGGHGYPGAQRRHRPRRRCRPLACLALAQIALHQQQLQLASLALERKAPVGAAGAGQDPARGGAPGPRWAGGLSPAGPAAAVVAGHCKLHGLAHRIQTGSRRWTW